MVGPNATVWITGASSGIGRALAHHLSREGRTIILSGRSRERLESCALECENAGAGTEVLPFDLSDASERENALAAMAGREIDALINNAGISQRARTVETDFVVDRRIMEIDYFAGVHLVKALLPGMVARGFGRIVAVSSMAGLIGAPLRSAYGAAKAAQIAFYSTLANELAGSGVSAHVVIAGFVRTEISRSALTGDGAPHGHMDAILSEGVDPERAAREITKGVERGRVRIRTGLTFKARQIFFFQRWFPRYLDRRLRQAARS